MEVLITLEVRMSGAVGKVFKLLPMYEEGFDDYYKYLERVIVELMGEEQTPTMQQTIVALRGLYNSGEEVNHGIVKRIVMRYTNRLGSEG